MPDSNGAVPQVGKKAAAICIFIITLLSFVTETQLAQVLATSHADVSAILTSIQYVQTSFGYRQPYFILCVFIARVLSSFSAKILYRSYIVHSAFVVIFPLHVLYLVAFKKKSARALLSGLSTAITVHMDPTQDLSRSTLSAPFPLRQFIHLSLMLATAYSLPALLWFASISLAS
jgi:hypothetical protein